MFINAGTVFGIIDMYRLVWIGGKFGGHKTAIAFAISEMFLKKGYRLVTNCRCVWGDDLEKVQLDQDNHLHAVVLLDEGGMYFKASRQIEQISNYAAKMDCIYLIPSHSPPAKAAQIITIQPIISLKATGIPLIIYTWRVEIGSFKDKGSFGWWNPAEIYGVYSRQDPGDDPEAIINFLVKRAGQYRAKYGRKEHDIFNLATLTEADKIQEAAEIISSSASDLSTVLSRKSKRK
jgi:hypothetical protein